MQFELVHECSPTTVAPIRPQDRRMLVDIKIPNGLKAGSTFQVQVEGNNHTVEVPPGHRGGMRLKVEIRDTPPQVAQKHIVGSVEMPQVVQGVPMQAVVMQPGAMPAAGAAIFGPVVGVEIQQIPKMLEVIGGCEAKNSYKVSPMFNNQLSGPEFIHVSEDSECCERLYCGPQRSLKWILHAGPAKNFPPAVILTKPCHWQGCCCMRPSVTVTDAQRNLIGRVEDPCTANAFMCNIDQKIYDANGILKYNTIGSICQCGMFCPCCGDVEFSVLKYPENRPAARIRKVFGGAGELCLGTSTFKTEFPGGCSNEDKALVFASTMLLEIAYFEKGKQ